MIQDEVLDQDIQSAHHGQTKDHGAPEEDVLQCVSLMSKRVIEFAYVEEGPASDGLAPLDRNEGNLEHHGKSSVATQLLGNAAHDKLVSSGADEEGNDCSGGAREPGAGGGVDVTAEEAVNGDVPFARKLKPVTAVPPVGVEVAVREACFELAFESKF